jgi:hypothetical protein
MQKVPGTVCSICYALKGRYNFPVVQAAMKRRLEIYNANPGDWVVNMVALLDVLWEDEVGEKVFRWFDSGDLQSEEMLTAIMDIAWCLPHGQFWLPTREVLMVAAVVKDHNIPPNLVIRLSANNIGSVLKLNRRHFEDHSQITTSSVGVEGKGWQCPAHKQGNKCGDCRACWSKHVPLVNYPAH